MFDFDDSDVEDLYVYVVCQCLIAIDFFQTYFMYALLPIK
jgi:hypothetical protein